MGRILPEQRDFEGVKLAQFGVSSKLARFITDVRIYIKICWEWPKETNKENRM